MIDAEPHSTARLARSSIRVSHGASPLPSKYAQPRVYRRSVGSRNWCAEDKDEDMSNMDDTRAEVTTMGRRVRGSRRDTWIIVCEHLHGAVGPVTTEQLAVELAACASEISACTYRPVQLALAQGRAAGRAQGESRWLDRLNGMRSDRDDEDSDRDADEPVPAQPECPDPPSERRRMMCSPMTSTSVTAIRRSEDE
jgi:hypothetical protein